MTVDLAAIRERDAEAQHCKTCLDREYNPYMGPKNPIHGSRAACEAEKEAPCEKPEEHHSYEPGGFMSYDSAALDRHVLLALLDGILAAAGPWLDDFGPIDEQHGRTMDLVEALRAVR